MWFAGMTAFRAVYVLDLETPITLHASSFLHMLPNVYEVGNGNVRSQNYLSRYDTCIEVDAPGVNSTAMLSRTMYGFTGESMEDAIAKLVQACN